MRPSRTSTCSMAKASAASLPGNSCRCRSASAAVGWRTGSMTIFLAFVSFSQCLCWCGAEAKGLAPQTRMQFGILGRARIEADIAGAVHVLQRGVAGGVADRIRIDLAGAEPVEEALRETAGQQRAGAGIVRVPDGLGAMSRDNILEPRRDLAGRLVPADGLEAAFALRPDALQRPRDPRLRIEPGAVIGDRAFAAQRAARHRMLGIAQHLHQAVGALHHRDAAGVIAVARTGGADDGLVGHGLSPDACR